MHAHELPAQLDLIADALAFAGEFRLAGVDRNAANVSPDGASPHFIRCCFIIIAS